MHHCPLPALYIYTQVVDEYPYVCFPSHPAGDPYLFEVMRLITHHYEPGWWVAAAAWPLTEIYKQAPLGSIKQKPGLVPTSVFFG